LVTVFCIVLLFLAIALPLLRIVLLGKNVISWSRVEMQIFVMLNSRYSSMEEWTDFFRKSKWTARVDAVTALVSVSKESITLKESIVRNYSWVSRSWLASVKRENTNSSVTNIILYSKAKFIKFWEILIKSNELQEMVTFSASPLSFNFTKQFLFINVL